jgi:hypothetical protein
VEHCLQVSGSITLFPKVEGPRVTGFETIELSFAAYGEGIAD